MIPIYDVDLSTGLSFLPGREHRYETDELRYTVKTNRFGRRDREWSEAELADPRNLLFVGDSFVMGNGVEDEDSIPTQLEARMAQAGTPREVFNFGMPGAGIPHYARILRDAVRIGVSARTVLVGVFLGNDFAPGTLSPILPLASTPAATRSFRPRSALLDLLWVRVSHSPRLVGWMLHLDGFLGIRLYTTSSSYIFLRHPRPEQAEIFRQILDHLRAFDRICRRHGRDAYVVIFPNRIQVENHESLSSSAYDAERPNRLIREYCERHGLRCFDQLTALSDAYARARRPLYFSVDRHLNEFGNRVAAESIATSLERAHALAANPDAQLHNP
jgi:hypothetical protein